MWLTAQCEVDKGQKISSCVLFWDDGKSIAKTSGIAACPDPALIPEQWPDNQDHGPVLCRSKLHSDSCDEPGAYVDRTTASPIRSTSPRVASIRCTHPLKVSFQYNDRKADSIVIESICGSLMGSTFQYISKIIPTVSPGDLPCHRQWRELTLALRAMPGSRFAGGGELGNARQPFRWGGRR